jgi:hypothetical protein
MSGMPEPGITGDVDRMKREIVQRREEDRPILALLSHCCGRQDMVNLSGFGVNLRRQSAESGIRAAING